MHSRWLVVLMISCTAFHCKQKNNHKLQQHSAVVKKSIVPLVWIVPLGNQCTDAFIQETYKNIKRCLPDVKVHERLSLPDLAYYEPRKRYRADSLIQWMSRMAGSNQVYIGITRTDISTTKNQYEDWGVMGLGYSPGNACVASDYRLKDKKAFWKVVLHELGHTAGLSHCVQKNCIMRDAEGGDPTHEETGFCDACKVYLMRLGWKL